jgi:hypothetical protein
VSGRARPAYDRWRDAEGVRIPDGCRVEQVAVSRDRGALACRLNKRGEVLGRSRSHRIYVRFDGEQEQVSIRPHLVRVVPAVRSVGQLIAELEGLRDLLGHAVHGDG